MKLAFTQMALGALVAVFSFISTMGGSITEFTLPADESGTVTTVEVFPGPEQFLLPDERPSGHGARPGSARLRHRPVSEGKGFKRDEVPLTKIFPLPL